MAEMVISALTRVKNDDGEYVVILPINTTEDVLVSLDKETTLADILKDLTVSVEDTKLTVIEDLSSVVNALSGLVDVKLSLNHIYRENFKDQSNLAISNGTYVQGSVKALQNQRIDFRLKNTIDLDFKPKNFKVTQIAKYLGTPALSCHITFNAKDTSPVWFDCTDALTSGLFAIVPDIPSKETGKPYSINMRIQCTCDSSSTYEISDFSILYV